MLGGIDVPTRAYNLSTALRALGVSFDNYTRAKAADFLGTKAAAGSVAALRAASSFKFFVAGGEAYLAVAQGLCDLWKPRDECADAAAPPRSAVLQWNRATRLFGELLALPDSASLAGRGAPVPDADLTLHSFALRIDAGSVREWEFFEAGGARVLVAASGTRGALAFGFDFNSVRGLRGVAAVAAGLPRSVFAVSGTDQALTVMAQGDVIDSLLTRRPCGSSGTAACLTYVATFSSLPDRRSPGTPALAPQALGPGVRGLLVGCPPQPLNGTNSSLGARLVYPGNPDLYWLKPAAAAAGVCRVAVLAGPRRDELLCGPFPAASGRPGPEDEPGAPCQRVSFSVETAATDNPRLFREAPRLHANGSLTYALARFQSGSARLRAVAEDDGAAALVGGRPVGGNRSAPREFVLTVDRINYRPTFLASDVFTSQDLPLQELVFAEDVGPGAPDEWGQALTWLFDYDRPQLFDLAPNLSVAFLGAGGAGGAGLFGVLRFRAAPGASGTVNFTVRLADSGPDDSAASGEGNVSLPQTFQLVVRSVNQVRGGRRLKGHGCESCTGRWSSHCVATSEGRKEGGGGGASESLAGELWSSRALIAAALCVPTAYLSLCVRARASAWGCLR